MQFLVLVFFLFLFLCYGVILQSTQFSSAINMLYTIEGAPCKSVSL